MMARVKRAVVLLLFWLHAFDCGSDFYSVLGVSRFASSREIKKAFHRLALKHHPDKDQRPNAQQTFTHIVQAYKVLTDGEKRWAYDQMGRLKDPDQGRNIDKKVFQHVSLEELLHSLRLDDDFFTDDQPDYEGWHFNFGTEDEDETVVFSDLFTML